MSASGEVRQRVVTLGDYSKTRVAIGAFEDTSVLCRCITELVGKNSISLSLFVLTPSETESAELKKICAMRLSAPVRQQVLLIAAGRKESSDSDHENGTPGTAGRLPEPELISNYARWLDQRSTRHLEETLAAGNLLLFVQVSNASQETDAFNSLSNHCTGAVRLHDLPAQ